MRQDELRTVLGTLGPQESASRNSCLAALEQGVSKESYLREQFSVWKDTIVRAVDKAGQTHFGGQVGRSDSGLRGGVPCSRPKRAWAAG